MGQVVSSLSLDITLDDRADLLRAAAEVPVAGWFLVAVRVKPARRARCATGASSSVVFPSI
jgi:hypothetical protein